MHPTAIMGLIEGKAIMRDAGTRKRAFSDLGRWPRSRSRALAVPRRIAALKTRQKKDDTQI